MLAKFGLSIVIAAGLLLSNCWAQSPTFNPKFGASSIPVSPAAFKSFEPRAGQDEDEDDPEAALVSLTEKLSKQVERLELRLRELEYDVEEKLDEPENSEAFKGLTESNEEFEERDFSTSRGN